MKFKVQSSAISYVEYNKRTHNLRVHFTDGKKQSYHGVPETVADELKNADSAGRYFNAHIRNVYPNDPT